MRSNGPSKDNRWNCGAGFPREQLVPLQQRRSCAVLVSHIPPVEMFDRKEAYDMFRAYGIIRGLHLNRDECIVEYGSKEEANLAVHKINALVIKGYKLTARHFSEGDRRTHCYQSNYPGSDWRFNDSKCAVLLHRRCPENYAEYVSRLLQREAKVEVCRTRPVSNGELIEQAVSNAADELGIQMVVVLDAENAEFNSATVYIVGHDIEEHRNMPLERAVDLFRSHTEKPPLPSGRHKPSRRSPRSTPAEVHDKRRRSRSNSPALQSATPYEHSHRTGEHARKTPRSALSIMFQLLADGQSLHRIEDYDDLIDYLKAKRENLVEPKRPAVDTSKDVQPVAQMSQNSQDASSNYFGQMRMSGQMDASMTESKASHDAYSPAAAIAAAAAYFAAATAAASQNPQVASSHLFPSNTNMASAAYSPAGAWVSGWNNNLPK